ncbi:hypothetical protein [Moraxella atlantae]|uniref:hypothetical protein n=1 Tax=Faucicola atlantae TaxID=34059 RepID=UPI000E1B57B4|nr:hypothetical protein [Moraxella atlantae]
MSPFLTKLAVSPLVCRLKPALLMALVTLPAVTRLFGSSPSLVVTRPSLPALIPLVFAVSWFRH